MQRFDAGGMREDQEGRPRIDLLVTLNVPYEAQFLTRLGQHMANSLKKYPERNWEQFADIESVDRAKAAAARHFLAWMAGETDEDHAAALVFNVQAAEHAHYQMHRDDKGAS